MEKTLRVINELESAGIIGKYAIGGAIGAIDTNCLTNGLSYHYEHLKKASFSAGTIPVETSKQAGSRRRAV